MYDNDGEENIAEFLYISQEYYYQELSVKHCWPISFTCSNCVVAIQGLVVRMEQTT